MRSANAGGGVADKLGNRYELAWAVRYALRCIQHERRSLTLEDLDPDLADGSEFTYVDEQGAISVTQVKRQNSANDKWTIAALKSRGVFAAAERHVSAGRKYHFSSMTPCVSLRVLSEWARQSPDVDQFLRRQLTQTLAPTFDELAAPDVFGSPERAWEILRGMWFEVEDESQLVKTNAMIASTLLCGAAEALLPVAIGAVLLGQLRRRLTRRELLDELIGHGVFVRDESAKRTAHEEVDATTESWRRTVQRELLSPPISRTETAELLELMRTTRLALVVGTAGGGKTSIAYQATAELQANGAEVLAFRLDRRESFGSTAELGQQLGLSDSPIVALQMAADGRAAYLVVDQLDAVSLASGRLSESYDVIADLIDEAVAVDGLSVILVCRLFDVENDHRIRKLDARADVQRLSVKPLPDEAVAEAVSAMGLNPKTLTPPQRHLLRTPLNLVLLNAISAQPTALNFTSKGSLFEAFWERKRVAVRRSNPGGRFNDVLARVANAVSDQQSLSVDVGFLDSDDYIDDAHVLASEQVLAIDGGRVSFFHEAFFDYTFARQWLIKRQSMVDFLCAQEQELFRRAQVRQILELLRERDVPRWRSEIEAVLSHPAIRYHIKEAVISVLANLGEPTDADLDLVLRLTAEQIHLAPRIWQQVTRPTWFLALHGYGLIEAWLDSAEAEERERGVALLSNCGADHSAIVVAILDARAGAVDYAEWLQRVVYRTDLTQNRLLFERLLEAVRCGEVSPVSRNLRLSTHNLADTKPLWAIEMIRASFVESPSALAVGDDGKVGLLSGRDYGVLELIQQSSKSEPRAFAEVMIPYLLDVMRETAIESATEGLIYDRHFGFRLATRGGVDDIDDVLYDCAGQALASWATSDPLAVEPLLQDLAMSRYDAAQALLFRALVSSAVNFADWSAELILEGGPRLHSGYTSDNHWLSREVVEAIAPRLSNELHERLEALVCDLRNPYEHRVSYGYTAFKFLSALEPERLTDVGRRRLAEYQRKFKVASPHPPTGIMSYSVGSPIAPKAADKMTDEQWLRAIAKHDLDDRGHRQERDPSLGGARELSHVLRSSTTTDPLRFAKLAIKMTAETNAAYPSAVLMGFGEATIPDADLPGIFDAIRHIMSLGLTACDRWLGWSLRRILDETPLDLVELVRDRALYSPNPEDNSPMVTRQDGTRYARDLRQDGINTARGSLAEELGDLLVGDVRGDRTAIVASQLVALAGDPVLSVRSCVAHTIAASLRHARPTAYAAFDQLIKCDDALLASELVLNLMYYIGNANPERIVPVIDRMLVSKDPEVRNAGGKMAAHAALQWEKSDLLDKALNGDNEVRKGAATACSSRIDRAANSELNVAALRQLMHDPDENVQKAVSDLVIHLKGEKLRPYASLLKELIASPSYVHATPQLLIVLQDSPGRVDDLVEPAAHRFLDLFETEVADYRTASAGDAHYIADLAIRGLAQADQNDRVAALLDIIDRLLQLGVYGLESSLEQAER